MEILLDVLFVLFLLSPLFMAIILMVRGYITKTDTMSYTKIIGLTFGFFNVFFLMMALSESGDGGGIFIGLGFIFFVIPINVIAFLICVLSDLRMKEKSAKNLKHSEQ